MRLKELNEETVKYFIGEEFFFLKVEDNFLYKDGKRTDEIDGSKVTIYSKDNPAEFINVKVKQNKSEITNGIHSKIDFKNLTGKFWIKQSGKYASQELSLKADSVDFDLFKK